MLGPRAVMAYLRALLTIVRPHLSWVPWDGMLTGRIAATTSTTTARTRHARDRIGRGAWLPALPCPALLWTLPTDSSAAVAGLTRTLVGCPLGPPKTWIGRSRFAPTPGHRGDAGLPEVPTWLHRSPVGWSLHPGPQDKCCKPSYTGIDFPFIDFLVCLVFSFISNLILGKIMSHFVLY